MIWPGLALITAGLVVGFLNSWSVAAVCLLITGVMFAIASLSALSSGKGGWAGFWQQRSTQANTNAALSVLSVLVILGLVNFVGAQYGPRVDLTEGQLLTLAPATQAVVKALDQPTEVLIFSDFPNPVDQQLLENYERLNSRFSYRYVGDPRTDPQLAAQIGAQTLGEVYVRQQGEEGRSLPVQTIAENPLADESERLTEQALTNRLIQLTQAEDLATVYFLQGHDEYAIDGSQAGFFEAASELEAANYTVAPLNLAQTGAVPPDADVIVVAGPQKEFFDAEIIALRDYLESGGSLLVMVDPQVTTGLEELMSQWGVVAEDKIVIDASQGGQIAGLGPAAPVVSDYGDHPITEAFDDSRSFYPVARPLQVREVPNTKTSPLLFTNQGSHAEVIKAGEEITVDPNQAPEGPFTLGVAVSRPVDSSSSNETENASPEASSDESEATEQEASSEAAGSAAEAQTEGRMVVIGNASFATDGLFGRQINGDVFLNSVTWLSKVDNPTLSIRPKEQTNRRIVVTVTQVILLTVLTLLVFPIAGLVGAGVLWARHR